MRKKILVLIGIFVLVTTSKIWAEEKRQSSAKYNLGEVIVTATKTEIYQAQVGSSTTVITNEDLKKKGKRTVLEALRDVPGVSVMQSGAFGGTTSVYLRGANVGHTLVLIDGVEVNDPMQMYGGFFDFAHLTTANIEQIEIIRGPQSPLYGSDAMGGVINIITKKGRGKPKWEASFEGGSHNTFKETLGLSGSEGRLDYSFSLLRLDSDGISKAADTSEDDGYKNTTISSRIAYRMFENSEFSLVLRYTDSEADLDDGAYDDDINSTVWWRNIVGKVDFEQAINPIWEHKLSFSYSHTKRKYQDEPDAADASDNTHNWYKGEVKKIEWQHNVYPVDWDTLTCGFEYEEQRGFKDGRRTTDRFDRKTVDSGGCYLQNQFKLWESLYITPGLRIDDHELSGTETTYKVSTAYIIPQTATHLKANWGTGFKSPSLYQLYSNFGDPALRPEESRAYDFAVEQDFLDNNLSFAATYFHNDFKNLIGWDSATSKYVNIDKARTKGIEVELAFNPIEDLRIGTNYTCTKTKDKDTGKRLTRRPEHQVGANLNWAFLEKGNVNLSADYIGFRWDNSANTQKVKAYTKVDLCAYYDLTERFQIFGRIENLFDKKFQQTRGYAVPGISFYAGTKATF